jgi:4,5-DOPA dioxygenase extradiol
MPTLFVSHGAPSLVLEREPARDFLAQLAGQLPRPSAIVVASAHWETAAPMVDRSLRPEIIHDFSGFPRELYAMTYPAAGSPALAERIAGLLNAAGLECRSVERGLDHGAWSPLKLIYPQAEVPVLQLALQPALGPAHHFALGRALSSLPGEGVLVLGSGGATHNLGALRWGAGGTTPAWASQFDDWLADAALRGDGEALIDYQRKAPQARQNHPTAEHYLPILVALGAAGAGARGRALHRSFTYGSLSMATYAFAAPAA